MRTIIINTLGSELRKNPLFYLPFQAEQFHWIEKDLPGIAACSEEIAAYQSEQGQRQDFHLILLVSLAQLPSAELASIRRVYVQILNAYLNEALLQPLCQKQQHPPVGVSVVYMLSEKTDGEGNVEVDRELDRIFGFREDMQELPALILKNTLGTPVVDLSKLFENAITSYNISLENQKNEPLAGSNYALEQLRRHIFDRLKSQQECLYIPVGMDQTVRLNSQIIEFAPLTTEWDLCCVDLQMNLCEHLQQNLDSSRVWELQLTPHDAKAIRQRIELAVARVYYLRTHSPQLAFYSMEADVGDPQSICGEIWEKLRGGTPLPGVEEAYLDAQLAVELREAAAQKEKETLAKELRHAWLLIGLEKKRFDGYYSTLQKQYEPAAADKQQKDILDICADVFAGWRRKLLSRKTGLPARAEEIEMPAFDAAAYEKEVAQAQQQWGEAAVAQLEDYTDVREEAEQVKADFRKAYRLWPDGEFNATSKFCVYSAVLAVLFVLQMLLPYIGITMGQEGVELSRYVHFTLSLLMFVGLYAVGLLIWLRVLCKQLQRHTQRMYWLLQDSHLRRRKSIVRAVEAYGEILPRCARCHEQLQQLQMLHDENLQRRERFNSHMKMLSKAQELLYELSTLLRMPSTRPGEIPQPKGGINFELPPSHRDNMPYYVFMSEKWGGA